MEFINKIINCDNDTELKKIVDDRLKKLYNNAIECDLIGLNGEAKKVHKGVIPRNTDIMFSNGSMSYYNMNNTDYYYDFAKSIMNYNLDNKGTIVKYIQAFSLNYFGEPCENDIRDSILYDYAEKNSKTDEELFNILDSFDISIFKNRNIALCTERAALAQNLLAFIGFETYYCIGMLNNDGNTLDHAFNVVVRPNDCIVYDTSVPVTCFENGKVENYIPYIDSFSKEKLNDFINGKSPLELENYEYIKENGKYVKRAFGDRKYVSGVTSNMATIDEMETFKKRI